MLNFEPNNWYVYIICNNKTNWLYIGLHHQVGNKSYSNSSSSILLKEAIENGNTSEYIVWKGKNAEKAAALETYLINLAKTNLYNLYNNNSGGGFKGGARPSILTAEDCNVGQNIILHKIYPKSVSDDDEFEINLKLRKLADNVRDAVKDTKDGKSNPHKIEYLPVDEVLNLSFLQIRENAVDKNNVEKVVESMLLDMKKAEYLVEPVSIVRKKDGELLRVDGTSTIYAIKEINKWTKAPVVFLDSDIFHDNETYMEVYATLRNRPEKHKGANDPKKELKNRIRNFHMANRDLFENDIETFQRKFMTLFSGSYSDERMRSNLSVYIRTIQEDQMYGDNWMDYSINDGAIIKQLAAKILPMFPRCSEYTHVSVTGLERVAPGNNLNYFGNTATGAADTAITIAEHTTYVSEGKEAYYFERYANSLAEAGFFPDKSKARHGYTPFVSKLTGKKIFVFFLPCRVNTKARINANYIFELMFDVEKIAA